VANAQAPTSIPVPEIVVEDISLDIGVGDDFGAGWGNGDGFGGTATALGVAGARLFLAKGPMPSGLST
jgi:hypothetical protein